MSMSPYQHIEETWGLDGNPFPHSAISGGWTDPYSPDVFPDEEAEFFQKTVRGALQGSRQVGFLWSKGPLGDTGYGKTALMRESVRKINADFGRQVEAITGMRDERIVPHRSGLLRAEHDEPDRALPSVIQCGNRNGEGRQCAAAPFSRADLHSDW